MKKDKNKNLKQEDIDEQENKKIYLGAAYSALANNCMEIDRQLLYLSSAGLGLLITFFLSQLNNIIQFYCWLFSSICFLLTIFICLYVLKINNVILEASINDKQTDTKLSEFLDNIAKIFFIAATIFVFVLSLTIVNNKLCFNNKFCKQNNNAINNVKICNKDNDINSNHHNMPTNTKNIKELNYV